MESYKKRVAKIERKNAISERRERAEKVMNYTDEDGSYFTPDEKAVILYKKVLGYENKDITSRCGVDEDGILVTLIKYKYINNMINKQSDSVFVRK